MASPFLSDGINAQIAATDAAQGLFLKDQPVGTLIQVVTGNTTYMIVTLNHEDEVALTSTRKDVAGPDVWLLDGSDHGGSLLKIGWIGEGMRMRLRRLAGGALHTSAVASFTFVDNPDEAQRITQEAEAKRPRVMTSAEQAQFNTDFDAAIEQILTQDFPDEALRSRSRELVGRFGNFAGKGAALGVLTQANAYGKLEEALQLLARDWEKHWHYQSPQVVGNPEFLPQNASRWEALYRELQIPTPGGERGE